MKFGEDTVELDEIDLQLIGELQADAKASLKAIGERVGLSAPAVMERVRKLEQAEVITGYHAMIDARRVGLDIAAFIGVAISNPSKIDEFEQWIEGIREVLECHHVTGRHTLLLKAKVLNTRALEHLISRIRSLDGVEATETMVVLSTHTERVQVALHPAEVVEEEDRRVRKIRRRAS
jgi:Lrp/AsnC family transcriptional regulator, leucine-responsive regulatory protein